MFEIDFKVDKKDLQDIRKMPKEFKHGMLKGVRKAMFVAEAGAKRDFTKSRSADGGLHVRSGHLRRYIQSGVKEYSNSVEGWIGSNVIYARIHELSGIIKPRAGKYLRFQIEGKWKTVTEVTIPKRPYLEPGITENINEIKNVIRSSIIKETSK